MNELSQSPPREESQKVFDIISAPFWKRLVAWGIDQILLASLVFLLFFLTFDNFHLVPEVMEDLYIEMFQVYVLSTLTYFTLLEGLNGQSLGKYILGVTVYKEDGSEPSFTIALLRRIGLVIPLFLIADGGAIIFASKNQRIFDIIAGTVVVKTDYESDAARFLKTGEIGGAIRKGVPEGVSYSEREKNQKTLSKLKDMSSKLEKRLEEEKIDEDQYSKLKNKYESRIESLEKKLEN